MFSLLILPALIRIVCGRDLQNAEAGSSSLDAVNPWIADGKVPPEAESFKDAQAKEFHWEEYYRLNPDLPASGLNTPEQAWSHYRCLITLARASSAFKEQSSGCQTRLSTSSSTHIGRVMMLTGCQVTTIQFAPYCAALKELQDT